MKSTALACVVMALLAIPLPLVAQSEAKQHHSHRYAHYQLIDIGTFGGPNSSYLQPLPEPGGRLLNSSGTAVGSGDTSTPDPSLHFL